MRSSLAVAAAKRENPSAAGYAMRMPTKYILPIKQFSAILSEFWFVADGKRSKLASKRLPSNRAP
jgi:hypothetical protein